MSLFSPVYRDQTQSLVPQVATKAASDEFDSMSSRISAWALVEHNEDGTHNVRPSGFDFVPIGGLIMWPGSSAPNGWLLCDGSQVSRTTYQALFNVVGTTYGAGDGSTTFNLPDLRQRFPIGKAASGTASTLGSTGGAIDHTHFIGGLTIPPLSVPSLGIPSLSVGGLSFSATTSSDGSHSHSGSTGSTDTNHTHTYSGTTSTGSAFDLVSKATVDVNMATSAHTHSFSGTTAGSTSSLNHSHSISADGTHSHTVSGTTGTGSTGTGSTGTGSTGTGNTGTGTSGTANPPYLVVNYIILSGV